MLTRQEIIDFFNKTVDRTETWGGWSGTEIQNVEVKDRDNWDALLRFAKHAKLNADQEIDGFTFIKVDVAFLEEDYKQVIFQINESGVFFSIEGEDESWDWGYSETMPGCIQLVKPEKQLVTVWKVVED